VLVDILSSPVADDPRTGIVLAAAYEGVRTLKFAIPKQNFGGGPFWRVKWHDCGQFDRELSPGLLSGQICPVGGREVIQSSLTGFRPNHCPFSISICKS